MQVRSVSDGQASERAAANARAEQTQRQLRRLEQEVGSLRQERARLLGNATELEQQLNAVSNELSQVQHTSSEEKRIADEERSAQVASLQRQLTDARGLHDQSASEVEELLRSQEELSGRYREEAKALAERSEALVLELRAESERLSIRNAELTSQLAQQVAHSTALERAEKDKAVQLLLASKSLREAALLRSQQSSVIAQLKAQEQASQSERKVLLRHARADHAASAIGNALAGPASAGEGSDGRDERGGKPSRASQAAAALEVERALSAARLAQRQVSQPVAATVE